MRWSWVTFAFLLLAASARRQTVITTAVSTEWIFIALDPQGTSFLPTA